MTASLDTRAKAVWRVLVNLQALILQGKRISFWHSPTQSLDLQIYIFQIIWTYIVWYLDQPLLKSCYNILLN